MKRARFHPAARAEVRAANAWYGARSPEAMREFTEAIARAVLLIRQKPEAWPKWGGHEIRCRVLERFPYSLYYVIDDDGIVIVAVAHQKRRTGYWMARTRKR